MAAVYPATGPTGEVHRKDHSRLVHRHPVPTCSDAAADLCHLPSPPIQQAPREEQLPDTGGFLRGVPHAGDVTLDPHLRSDRRPAAGKDHQEGGRAHAAAEDGNRARPLRGCHGNRRRDRGAEEEPRPAPPPDRGGDHQRRRRVALLLPVADPAARPPGRLRGVQRDQPSGVLLQAVPGEHAEHRGVVALLWLRARGLPEQLDGDGGPPQHRARAEQELVSRRPQQGEVGPLLLLHCRVRGPQLHLLRCLRQVVQIQSLDVAATCNGLTTLVPIKHVKLTEHKVKSHHLLLKLRISSLEICATPQQFKGMAKAYQQTYR